MEEVAAQKAAGKYLTFIRSLARPGAIILDDFGLRTYNHDEAMALMDIFEERYRKGATIVTSQIKPEGWLSLVEDRVTAEALVDRLQHPSSLIQLKGGSYREKFRRKSGDKKVNSDKS